MDELNDSEGNHKKHNEPHGGRKAEKKKAKNQHNQEMTAKQRNPKAFAFNSVQKAERQFRRTMDIRTKKEHIPHVDRTVLEPPPFIVAIVGPPKVGKTTLMRCLIKNFCRQNLSNIQGPVTIVSGKKRRLTLIECNNDINCMIDLAKVCDLALLLVDASFGFEMETFEFLNICQVHGFPKIMGVLTHLDVFKNAKTLRRTKKQMKHRFWTEIYQGAKLFYLSGMVHDEYMKNEVHNLGRFISVMKFHPQLWRQNHSYILADRMEDLTNLDLIRKNPLIDRTICLYGYTRGAPLKNNTKVHIPGCSDFPMNEVSFLPDPCPLPDKEKKRSLNVKERLIYAPMSGVGGIVYDKDAVYIELGGSHSHKQKETNYEKELISTLIQSEHGLDSKMEASAFTLFSGAKPFTVEEIETNDFEHRRKVSFDDEDNENIVSDDDEDNENIVSDDDEDNENIVSDDDVEVDKNSDNSDDEQDEEFSDDEEQGHLKWKENLASKASLSFEHRQRTNVNLSILVYGTAKTSWGENSRDSDEEDEIIGGIFRRANQLRSGGKSEFTYSNLNGEESSKSVSTTRNWNNEDTQDLIKDCFVTGKWDAKNDAKTILDHDEDMFGDFEDLESGEIQKGVKMDESSEGEEEEDIQADTLGSADSAVKKTRAEKIIEKKKKLKAMFDIEYDEKDGKSFYDDLKAEMSEQAQLNRSEFENLSDEKRVQLEGFRSGLYVRVEIENVPCEFVKHFDSTYPIILGSLLHGEDTLGYVQVRLKKHRWYKRILKTRDPLIFSLGWRRFQTIPIYSIEDHNGRNRMLKYTPQHLYCLASFWGPITPQGAGILALQSLTEKTSDFRIAATGVVLDLDKSTEIMKKLKLTGEPLKIYKKTVFVKGMFNSALEVTKFEGASLRTVSGLRGQIKKAIRAPPGAFRATFEDKILLSDIVFLRSWYAVDVPQFYAPVTSLLLPPEDKLKWKGMKTVGQLKREKEIHITPNEDSLYTPIERKEKIFKELKIPRSLNQQLPFAEKKKYGIVDKAENIEKQRIAVIQEPHEREVTNMMKMIKTVHSAKIQKIKQDMVLRAKTHKLDLKKMDEKRNNRQKMIKKRVFQALGKMKQNKE